MEAIEANKVERIQTIETTVIGLYRGSYIKEKDFLSGGKYDFRSRIITRESFYEDIKKIEAKKTGRPVEDITASDFSFTIDVQPPPEAPWWLNLLPFGIVIILFGLFWFFFMQQTQGAEGQPRHDLWQESCKVHTDKRRTTFRDVAGADEEKEELRDRGF